MYISTPLPTHTRKVLSFCDYIFESEKQFDLCTVYSAPMYVLCNRCIPAIDEGDISTRQGICRQQQGQPTLPKKF